MKEGDGDATLRIIALIIGSIAAGFAFGWVAGIAALFLFFAVLPI